MGMRTSDLVVKHETSVTANSNTVSHYLQVGTERFWFEEDTKVSVFLVNGRQFPRMEDAIMRALLVFRDQISSKSYLGESGEDILNAIDLEIDRQVASRRRLVGAR